MLIRDAAYAAITKGERARLHERLARWLDERGELDEIVGHHLEQAALYRAELGERRCGRLRRKPRAGWALRDDARCGRAAPTAVPLLSRAIALEPDDERRLELELDLGTALKFSGDRPRRSSARQRGRATRARRGDRRIELRAEVELFWPLVATER